MNETLEISGLTFEVRRSMRRRTLSLIVDRTGELVVHARCDTAKEELARWIRSAPGDRQGVGGASPLR
jgi:hypothetical protein